MPLKKASSPKKDAASSPKRVKKAAKASPKSKKEKGPKRPASAYLYFSMERRIEIVKADPSLKSDIAGVAKMIGAEWRELSASQKTKFEDLAKKDRLRYETEKKKAAK